MRKLFILHLFCLLHFFVSAQNDRSYFRDNNNTYQIFSPNDWIYNGNTNDPIAFETKAPTTSDKDFPPMIVLEIEPVETYGKQISLEQIRQDDIETTKKQSGDKLTINQDGYKIFNNKKWWMFSISEKISRKKTYRYFILKTLHNRYTYSIAFRADKEDFDTYFAKAVDAMFSFMFLTSDHTYYGNNSSVIEADQAKNLLRPFEGKYVLSTTNGITNTIQSIIIGKEAGGTYNAKEIREITYNGAKVGFEAELRPEHIDGSSITLSTDSIILINNGTYWKKVIYELHKDANGLSGKMIFSKDSLFKVNSSDVTFQYIKPSPIVSKNDDLPKADKKLTTNASSSAKQRLENNIENCINLHNVSFKSMCTKKCFTDIKNEMNEEETGEADNTVPDWTYCTLSMIQAQDYGKVKVTATFIESANNGDWYEVKVIDPEFNASYLTNVRLIKNKNSYLIDEIVQEVNDDEVSDNPTNSKNQNNNSNKPGQNNDNWAKKAAEENKKRVEEQEKRNKSANTGISENSFTLDHKTVGSNSADELGRRVLNAFKNNDFNSYLQCINGENTAEIKRGWQQVRKSLQSQGVSDWSKIRFSRVSYCTGQGVPANSYGCFKIEFEYGTSFWGATSSLNGATWKNGKLFLNHSYNDAGIRRR
ncbi:MAG TPA: hypothetical protein VFS36_01275 [Chitinophagaceae bacterium]|nr:hypothetical protein [Chitinophagaceae bacterium]